MPTPRILVTRPEPQNQQLCDMLNDAGFEAVSLPTIRIKAITPTLECAEQCCWPQLKTSVQGVICTSAYAVQHTQTQLKELNHQTRNIVFFAIGQRTAQAMNQLGIAPVISPTDEQTSEGLLAMHALKPLQHVLIVGGEGGRPFLASKLRERGVIVDKLMSYQRICPTYTQSQLAEKIHHIHGIVCTSNECLINLFSLIESDMHSILARKDFFGVNSRLSDVTEKLQITGPLILANSASNQDILQAIMLHYPS